MSLPPKLTRWLTAYMTEAGCMKRMKTITDAYSPDTIENNISLEELDLLIEDAKTLLSLKYDKKNFLSEKKLEELTEILREFEETKKNRTAGLVTK